ncbi:MAG: alanine--tRNA ligase [Candidatus Nealsonbacteria bacterium]
MTSKKLRSDFLKFFKKKGHKIVPSSSLLPTDSSVLFTTAGMQQFKEYFLDKKSPYGDKVVSVQQCFRTSDIEEVGDKNHLTFLEMLGNFSFNGYFKKEAIKMSLELMTKVYKLPLDDLWFTYFKGDKDVPEDIESKKLWQGLGIPENRIHGYSREDNFWGPTGKEGPCGPTTEIHYDLTHQPCKKEKMCLPNCSCGRFLELWNLVFNEYYQDETKNLTLLKKKGVDTGMGLERLAMVSQNVASVFETDLFSGIISAIEKISSEPYNQNPKPYRIVADHIRGAVFLAAAGLLPSNIEQGYVLRRVLRRVMRFGRLLNFPDGFLISLAKEVIASYKSVYPEVKSKEAEILAVIQKEEEKFVKTLFRGLKEFEKIAKLGDIEGKDAFHLFDTYGFPLELTQELAQERRLEVDKEGFSQAFKEHRTVSRAGVESKFGGVGKEAGYESVKLHTATHLLHAALRQVLGKQVKQMGSDISSARLRFDFAYSEKMTPEQVKKVEDIVNEKIKADLAIEKREVEFEEAVKSGALAFFREKYPDKVTVYSAGGFSKEICGGPHVKRTSELGSFKIVKEESSSAGTRRIRAILE